jgi:hypothetical protein
MWLVHASDTLPRFQSGFEHQVHKSVHETGGGHFFYALRKEGVQGVPRNFFVLQPIPIPGYICEGGWKRLLDV